MKKIFFLNIFVLALGTAYAQSEKKEADLEAVFIYNFTKFITWDSAYLQKQFTIGVMGNTEITSSLSQIALTNTVGDKKILIRQFSTPEDILFCNILFIPKGFNYPLSSILDNISKGVLTISEQPGYAKEGVAFNFVVVNDKLKFESNRLAIEGAGLKASSQLLKLAIVIYQ